MKHFKNDKALLLSMIYHLSLRFYCFSLGANDIYNKLFKIPTIPHCLDPLLKTSKQCLRSKGNVIEIYLNKDGLNFYIYEKTLQI